MSDLALGSVISNEAGYSVECPRIVAVSSGNSWVISAVQDEDGGCTAAKMLPGHNRLLLSEGPGCYGSPKATACGSRAYVAFTHTCNGLKRLLLGGIRDGNAAETIDVADGFAKHDAPCIAAQDNRLWVSWEACDGSDCFIWVKCYDLSGDGEIIAGSPAQRVSIPGARSYRPALVCDGDGTVYLIYESFYDNRYRLLLQHRSPREPSFSEPIEIGFPDGNDQCASVCRCDAGVLVAWENSQPLQKDYVYPLFPEITIPAFGHGWKINTRTGLRRIALVGGAVSAEAMDVSPEVRLDTNQSTGCPSLAAGPNGELVLGYVTFCSETFGWRVRLKQSDGNRWREIGCVDKPMPQRIPPTCAFDANGNVLVGSVCNTVNGRAAIVSSFVPERGATPGFLPRTPIGRVVRVQAKPAPRHSIAYRGEELRLWWGDLHMHSNISSCSNHFGFHCTELEEKYRFSRDVGALDFAMVTDHDGMTDQDWDRTVQAAQSANMPGDFVAFAGYEWTSSLRTDRTNYGHRNVLFASDRCSLFRCTDPGGDSPEALWKSLAGYERLTIPHHTSCVEHLFNWDYQNPEVERLVEIFQVRGSFEHDNCDMWPEDYGRPMVEGHSVREALRRGYRLGFTSGGEHEGVGVTAVYAADLDRPSIFEALRARRVYGTTGARILLDFRVNGSIMGEDAPASDRFEIGIAVRGTDDISSVRLVSDGCVVKEWVDLGKQAEIQWTDSSREQDGRHYYYCVVAQADGEMAWSSPVFCRASKE